MQRIRIATIAFAALATLSFTTAAYSVMGAAAKNAD